jgi:hypothetical protein
MSRSACLVQPFTVYLVQHAAAFLDQPAAKIEIMSRLCLIDSENVCLVQPVAGNIELMLTHILSV